MRWRAMAAMDLPAVVELANALFPDHYEAPERFAERLQAAPDLCRVLACGGAEAIRGYCIAYPWPLGRIPPLDRPLPEEWRAGEAVYLHDLGLHPEAAGRGHARAAIADLVAQAGQRAIALVAVNRSAAFWAASGFREELGDAALADKLAGYGPYARYMVRRP
ncbi:Acetyltransferase (GNAT) family protein [Methylobacterium gossipiicola]|uniref:Acetyltransferase (GNAT) family protein n=1 Tax=Methylobacterium gossipiicola TaxID=582675 RepID=A0A1I2V922_9HYPH|nr:Acetyltransferase (GNAT) family protein [Methylobacterium gossipiicola]